MLKRVAFRFEIEGSRNLLEKLLLSVKASLKNLSVTAKKIFDARSQYF